MITLLWATSLFAVILSATAKHVDPVVSGFQQIHRLKATSAPSGLEKAPYILSLSGSKIPPQSHRFLRISNDILSTTSSREQPITAINLGRTWNTKVNFGDQTLTLVFDTGSSDTWVVDQDLQCFDYAGRAQAVEDCYFGPVYQLTDRFKPIKGQEFKIRYGDGEWAQGRFGFEDVSLAGLRARCQVAVVEKAYWMGDGVSSGLLGFGLPALTSSFDKQGNISTYEPVFSSLYRNNNIDPVFSVALGRSSKDAEDTGALALGGLPDVEVSSPWVSLPLQFVSLNRPDLKKNEYTFYSINVDDIGIGNSASKSSSKSKDRDRREFSPVDPGSPSDNTFTWASSLALHKRGARNVPWGRYDARKSPEASTRVTSSSADSSSRRSRNTPALVNAIVDTGTTLNYFPRDIADFIAKGACSTAGRYSETYGVYLINCDSTCRPLGVRLKERVITVESQDVLLRQGSLCYLGVTRSGAVNILGGTFLKNVVVAFDQGAAEIRFAQRKPY